MPANEDGDAEDGSTAYKKPLAANPSLVNNTTVLLNKETWKTCPRCEHILKEGLKNNLHFTLAYSRCRCHRTWRYTVDRLSSDSTAQLAGRGGCRSTAKHSTTATTRSAKTVPALDLNKMPLPTISRKFSALSYHQNLSRSLAHRKRKPGKLQPSTVPLPMIVGTPNEQSSESQSAEDVQETVSTIPTDKLKSPTSPSPSVPKLPQIHVTSTSNAKLNTMEQAISSFTRITRPQTSSFEFVHLLKYVSSESRTIASKVFSMIDHNGDGHLTFSEVMAGIQIITGTIANLSDYINPIYHLLGDSTYFGKRDFILCHTLAEIIQKSSKSVPKLSCPQSVDFFNNTLKPVMTKLITIAIEGKVSLNDIEATVKTCGGSDRTIVFIKSKALRVCEEGKLSLLQLMALAPHLFIIPAKNNQ